MAESYWIRYQIGDSNYEKHKVAPEAQWDEIRASAMRVTPLAYSQAEDADGKPKEEVFAKGDFWIDLDGKSLQQTIDDMKALVSWLEHNHVDLSHVQFFASGSKGFHLCIPAKILKAKAEKALWESYRCLARAISEEMDIFSIDYSLYDYKHLLRTEGKQRSDGRYKVPLTLTEVHGMTVERYEELTSSPRPTMEYNRNIKDKDITSFKLPSMMEKARQYAAALIEAKKRSRPIPNEALAQFNDTHHPRCIDYIINQVDVKPKATFNELAMNVASYVAVAPNLTDAGREAVINELAGKRVAAVGGRAATERLGYIWDKVRFANAGTIQFRCMANHGVLTCGDAVCEGCPVRSASYGEVQEGIEAREDGYYSVRGETPRRLSNWVLAPGEGSIKVYKEMVEDPSNQDQREIRYRWDKMEISLICEGKKCDLSITQNAFTSANQWKKEVITQIERGIWFGTDADVQSLKLFLTDPKLMDSTIKVKSAGIHQYQDDQGTGWVYAEPGYSVLISDTGRLFTGTHVCIPDTRMAELRHLRKQEPARADNPQDVEALELLLRSNQDHVVAHLLAWVCACHIKPHWRTTSAKGFPLLHLWGSATAGKSASAMTYCALGGSDYTRGSTTALSDLTAFPLKAFTVSTTTIPRILDEVNEQRLSKKRYKDGLNILRSAYGDGVTRIGGLGKEHNGSEVGARQIEWFQTTPLIYIATQQNQVAELKERSIEVHMPKHHSLEHTEAFERLQYVEVMGRLFGFCKLLMLEALTISTEDIRKWRMDVIPVLPPEFKDRNKDNHAALLCGLRLMDQVLRKHGFSQKLIDRVEELRSTMVAWWFDHLSEYLARQEETEILRLFKRFAQLASSKNRSGERYLSPQIHFIMTEKVIYFDLNSCFMQLEMVMNSLGKTMEFESPAQIRTHLQEENYYLGFGPLPGDTLLGEWLLVDRCKLEQRGVDVRAFWG